MNKTLTSTQEDIITQAYHSYDCSMSDPWRNDFEEDGQSADEWRYDNMINDIREQMPDVDVDIIEMFIDYIR